MCRTARKRIPASSDFLGKAVLPLSAILLFTVAVIFNCLTSSFAFADVTTTANPTDSENIPSNSTTDESSTTDTQQQDNHLDGAQPQSNQRSTASSPQINIDESTSDQPVTDQPPANGWAHFGDLNSERWYQNGSMAVSTVFTDPSTGNRYYANSDGSIAHDVDTSVQYNGSAIIIRLASDGHMVTGFDQRDGATYYFNPDNGAMVHGEQYITSDKNRIGWYYFSPDNGRMAYGMQYLPSNGGKWVYYDATTGIMAHGERYVNYDRSHTGWYYFDQWTGKMAHGNVYVPAWGKWCWTGIDGILQGDTPGKTGWQNPAAFYQVSSKNVRRVGQGLFSYIQPSRLSVTASRNDAINIFIQTALSYLGSPYKWDYALWPGGGTDCAGLVISSMESVGMQTPYNAYDHRFQAWQDHDADNMWNDPRIMKVAIKDRRRGDLVFYPGHVAIYLGNDTIVNAYPPRVEYDSMWRWGIRGIGRLFI